MNFKYAAVLFFFIGVPFINVYTNGPQSTVDCYYEEYCS